MTRRQAAPAHALPFALPLALAALGVAPALAAGGGGGISVTPPLLEHSAVPGKIGSVKVANGTGQALKVSVSLHPWIQAVSGLAVPNQRATLSGVQASVGSFTLANGTSRVVSVSLLRGPAGGSLYGNLDVTAIPTRGQGPNAVTIGYRLVASIRLDPLHPVRAASAGAAVVSGSAQRGTVELAVRNTGNTLEPIGGTVRITGARGAETGSIGAVRILPGRTVDVPVFRLDGALPGGSYTLTASLAQGGRRILSAKRSFTLR
jgi:hypothetical protein